MFPIHNSHFTNRQKESQFTIPDFEGSTQLYFRGSIMLLPPCLMLKLFPLDAFPLLGGRVRGHHRRRRSLLRLDVIADAAAMALIAVVVAAEAVLGLCVAGAGVLVPLGNVVVVIVCAVAGEVLLQ